MAIYFTSDTHFGHENIIKLCDRPFQTIEEMDEGLISRWNETVSEGDTVYHLGDFSFRGARGADHYRAQLNGDIHLLAGNHDDRTLKRHDGQFLSVNQILEVRAGRQHIVLCHYPMREWHGVYRRWWHLFGHVHGRLDDQPLGYSMDVGVDSNGYRPVSLEEIAEIFASRDNPFTERRKPARRQAAF